MTEVASYKSPFLPGKFNEYFKVSWSLGMVEAHLTYVPLEEGDEEYTSHLTRCGYLRAVVPDTQLITEPLTLGVQFGDHDDPRYGFTPEPPLRLCKSEFAADVHMCLGVAEHIVTVLKCNTYDPLLSPCLTASVLMPEDVIASHLVGRLFADASFSVI